MKATMTSSLTRSGLLLRLFAVVALLVASSAWAAPGLHAAKSTATANPTTVIANGVAFSTITVTVNRSNGKSAGSGISVTLTAGSGSSTITPSPPLTATTNNSGIATFTVKDAVVESVTYTAVATESGSSITISQRPVVNFVRAAPTVVKSFSPTTIAANGTSTLTITLTNSNSASITGATFTDTYPANLVNAGTPALSNSCGGTATAAAGGTSLALSGGTISASGSCTVTVTVTSATAGSYLNSTGAVTSTNAAPGTAATATLTVTAISAVNSTVAASPTTVLANGVATSTITVTLRDGANLAVSGKTVTLTKSGGSSTISAASGTSDVNGVVTFTVKDTVAETTTYTAKDTTDNITVTQTAAVTFVLVPILKSFATSPIAINGTSTLTVTLTNATGSSVSGAGFSDTYPAGLVNAGNPSTSGSCGSGVLSGTSGGSTLGISGVTIAANSACTVSVSVTAATAGSYSNTATNTSSSTSTASLVVTAISPTLSTVSASPTSVAANGTSTSTITVTLKDGAGNPVSGKTVSLSAATGSSVITAVSNTAGVATFTVTDTVAEGPITYTAKDTTDNITVTQTASVTFTRLAAPTVAKSFSPGTIADYGTSTLTITLTNPNTAAISGVAFTDTYPATGGLANTSSLVIGNTCGGTNPGTAANGTTLTLSGGTIPASGSCTVSVQVTAAFPGTTAASPITNSTGAVTSLNATSGTAASATLTVVNVSATNSTVVASPTSVPADNTSTSTITVTLRDGAGNPVDGTNVSLVGSAGSSSTITVVSATTDVNGVATFTVKDSVAETVTYTATDTTDIPNVVITQQAVVTFGNAIGNFDAVEVGAAKGTKLYTKLSGTGFSLDILALTSGGSTLTSYVGTVTIELVDATTGAGVCASMNPLTPLTLSPTSPYTFVSANNGRKTFSFTYAKAAANSRVRIKDAAAGLTFCSTDNFSVRPTQLTVTAPTMSNGVLTGVPKSVAGTAFTLDAGAGVTSGYTGTPVLDVSKVQDHASVAIAASTLSGAFSAGTGTKASGAAFKYLDVGNIKLLADAVVDIGFTTIDQASGDCIVGSTSTTLTGGKYGCNIGSAASATMGRWYPSHYSFAGTLTPACGPGGMTYMDQDALGVALTLKAHAFSGAAAAATDPVVSRYTMGYTNLAPVTLSGDNSGTPVAVTRLGSPAFPAMPSTASWNAGLFQVNDTYAFSKLVIGPDGAYDLFKLKAALTDPDGSLLIGLAAAQETNTTKIRYGRIQLQNAYGSEYLALPVPLTLQHWNGNWQKNTLDTCTSIQAGQFAWSFPAGSPARPNNLAACESAATVTGVSPNYVVTLSAPGVNNAGWADLSLNLAAVAAGSTCTTVNAGTGSTALAGTANAPWLQYNWTGAVANPKARATFGIFKSPLIYRRENY